MEKILLVLQLILGLVCIGMLLRKVFKDILFVLTPSKGKERGRFFAIIGMLLSVAYAIYIFAYFSGLDVDTLSNALAAAYARKAVEPHMYIVLAGAGLSLFGCIGWNKTCILLAAIAMFGAGIVFPMYFKLVIVQAVLLLIAYLRMTIPVKKEEKN